MQGPPLPLVSCVLATYNFERFIERSIDSILAQDYPRDRLELIVVDDGSEDRTPELVEPYGDRVTYIRKPNGGLLSTLNCGLAECRGELIALASGDDEWKPDSTRRQVELLSARPELGLVYGDLEVIDADGQVIDPSFLAAQEDRRRGRAYGRLLCSNYISGGGMMFRASFLDRIHPIPSWVPYEDWWIALRVAETAEVDELGPPAIYRYRSHGSNRSLAARGDKLLGLIERELPFRARLLRGLRAGQATAEDLVAAVDCFLGYLASVATGRGTAVETLVDTPPDGVATAEATAAAAAPLLAAGDLDAAAAVVANAIGSCPLHAGALGLLDALRQRAGAARAAPAGVPQGLRRLVTVALASEVVADPRLLASYAEAITAGDDATLVVYAPDWTPARAQAELGAAVAAAGLDGDDAADVLAHVVPRSRATEALLVQAAKARLSERAEPGPLGDLPRVGVDSAATLRDRLAERAPASA